MRKRSAPSTLLWALGLVTACGRQGGTSSAAPAAPPAPATTTASASASASASTLASTTAATASARPVGLRVDVTAPGNVVLRNEGDAAVRVAWELPIEKEVAGTWTAAHSLSLMTRCFEPKPADGCVSIAPHASFTPLPWTGWFGCTQCGSCRANAPAGEGRYRVVAVECDGGARHEGPPMEIVDDGRFAHTPHVYAPASAPSAVWIDNESDEPVSFRTAVEVLKLDAARGAYEVVGDAKMTLEGECPQQRPACVTVPARGRIHPSGHRPGCEPCKPCGAASNRPGTYMLRVSVCDGRKPLYNEVYGYAFTTAPFVSDANGAVKPARP